MDHAPPRRWTPPAAVLHTQVHPIPRPTPSRFEVWQQQRQREKDAAPSELEEFQRWASQEESELAKRIAAAAPLSPRQSALARSGVDVSR